jgi:hypothetical protein
MVKGAKDYEKDYTHPELRERLKEEIKQSDRGGASGKWSARKSQLLTQEYEKQGGGYEHPGERTEAQQHLQQWTDEQWQTADGSTDARGDDGTDRYLPKKAWEQMSDEEKEETRKRKREASKQGQGDVPNTPEAKTARKAAHLDGLKADEAVKEARKLDPSDAQQALEHERDEKDRKTVEQALQKAADKG